MYDQVREDTFYMMLYAVVTTTAIIASCYLLFRQGNAFARDITPPLRLRRWAAVLVAAFALNHVWYMPILFLSSNEDITMVNLVGGLLDSMTLFPLSIIVLFTMLQDRRRLLWPVALVFAPLVVLGAFCVATHSYAFQPMAYVYFLLMCFGLIIYMVHALRQYGRWLRDNYADLEHKEVWQSFVVLAIILLVFVIYVFVNEGTAYLYAMQVIIIILICYLVWRVETLSDLSIPVNDVAEEMVTTEDVEDNAPSLSMRNNIGPLLKQHCEEPQLYLQYDITLSQLAQIIGTNRLYLSQYFSSQHTTYNAYINGLREMANRLGATVFSPEYTLTSDPSYTYHIELDEAFAGLTYVHEHGEELHVDGDNIVIMGESAGGGLTTRMALWNKDKGNVPVRGAVLIYPMLDYRTGGPDDLHPDDMTGEFVWHKEENVKGWADLKHGQEIPADEFIYYSPAVATPEQLKGFPTTFLIVGTLDLFVYEDLAFVEQLKLAGVQVDSFVEPGVPHSYNVILNDSPQTIRFKDLRDKAVKQMFK